jgi:DMSO/TMAO reductase YedYZ molybdopterin-dependent catalytic subunit
MAMFEFRPMVAPAPRVNRKDWGMNLVVGRDVAYRINWALLRSLPHTTLPDISSANTNSSSADVCWEGVLVDIVLEAIGLVPSHGFVLAHSLDGRSFRIPARNLTGRRAMVATSCQGAPLTADCGGPARLQLTNPASKFSMGWISALQFPTNEGPRVREYSSDQTLERSTGFTEHVLYSSAYAFHARRIRSIRPPVAALKSQYRPPDMQSIAWRVGQCAERQLV